MLDTIQSSDFEKWRDQAFRLSTESGSVIELRLTEVKKLREAQGDAKRDSFSLIFHHEPGEHLPQGIYQVEHAELGTLGIFLVPLTPDEKGCYLQAIFT